MTGSLASLRSLLFTPATRPDRIGKGHAAGADAVIVDLEDGVGIGDKGAARDTFATWARTGSPSGPVLLRLNHIATAEGLVDLIFLRDLDVTPTAFMLPKVESAEEVRLAVAHLPPGAVLVALIESARGLHAAPDIAQAPGVSALAFGGADLAADLGASLSWGPMLHARSALVAAAAQAGLLCWDVPCLDIRDVTGLARETRQARALGFSAKMAIHPDQVKTINQAFTPTADDIARARRIADAFTAARGGACSLDGKMIDRPVVRAAERILALAGRDHAKETT